MNFEVNERNVAIAGVLGALALLLVGYAQAQATNDTATSSTGDAGTPATPGGHVCPKDAAATADASTPATSNASAA